MATPFLNSHSIYVATPFFNEQKRASLGTTRLEQIQHQAQSTDALREIIIIISNIVFEGYFCLKLKG